MHLGCWQAPTSAPGCGHLQGLQGWQVEDLVPQRGTERGNRREKKRDKDDGGLKDDGMNGDEVERIIS